MTKSHNLIIPLDFFNKREEMRRNIVNFNDFYLYIKQKPLHYLKLGYCGISSPNSCRTTAECGPFHLQTSTVIREGAFFYHLFKSRFNPGLSLRKRTANDYTLRVEAVDDVGNANAKFASDVMV